MSETQLRRLGLDYETIRSHNSHVVYCHLTPSGRQDDEGHHPQGRKKTQRQTDDTKEQEWDKKVETEEETALLSQAAGSVGAACWFSSGLARGLALPPDLPKLAPRLLDAMLVSFSVFSAASVGLFHLQRAGRSDRLVHISALRAGLWANLTTYAVCSVDVLKGGLFTEPKPTFHMRWPNITSNVFKTKDGAWIQLLGVEMFKSLPKMFKVFPPPKMLFVKLAAVAVCQILPAKPPDRLFKAIPAIEMLNNFFASRIITKEWKEWKKIFKQYDIWHCLVNTPKEASENRQAWATHSFLSTQSLQNTPLAKKLFVAPPVQFSDFPQATQAGLAPVPGAHTTAILDGLLKTQKA
eukprot:gb/GEZN01010422.1/.p1 GENE.gb/GEZN01010422.1/~~gb/GEZN01010422.1/.p1  ORF type:complete len:369 (-),score=56.21 gb/GEZN01010422.1/:134-1189(-)